MWYVCMNHSNRKKSRFIVIDVLAIGDLLCLLGCRRSFRAEWWVILLIVIEILLMRQG